MHIRKVKIAIVFVFMTLLRIGAMNSAADYEYIAPEEYVSLATSSLLNTNPLSAAKTKIVYITAYSSTPEQTDDTPFITASGSHVRDGIVAANWLPIGAKVKIPTLFGDKIFTVEDRMNRRFSNRMDIWFAETDDALKFGLRKATVEIL